MSDTAIVSTDTVNAYIASNYSSIQITDSDTRKTVLNAMNNAESLSRHQDEELSIIGVMTKPGVRRSRDKNGVDLPCTDTILVGANGTAYFSQSEGVRKAVDLFFDAKLFDNGEIISMKLVASELPNGNTLKTLVLV